MGAFKQVKGLWGPNPTDPDLTAAMGMPGIDPTASMPPAPSQTLGMPASAPPPIPGGGMTRPAPPALGPRPVSLASPNTQAPAIPGPTQAGTRQWSTKKAARNADIVEGIAGFQNAMQRGDAQRQQKLYQQGESILQAINAVANDTTLSNEDARRAQENLIKGNEAALRARGVNLPSAPGSKQSAGIGRKILNTLGGVQDRSGQRAPVDDNALSGMTQISAEQQAANKMRASQATDAAAVQEATAGIDPKLRAGIAAGTVARPADIAKAESAAADKAAAAEAAVKEKRKTTFRLKGLDEEGENLPDDQLPPEIRIKKIQAQAAGNLAQSRVALNEATIALKQAELTGNLPSIQIHRQAVAVAQQNANISEANYLMHAKGTDRAGNELAGIQHTDTGAPVGTAIQAGKNAADRVNAPTAATKTKADQAQIVMKSGQQLIDEINHNRSALGPLSGRISSLEVGLGSADPAVRSVFANMKSFAALQPALHGSRGVGMQKEFEKASAQLADNPDAAIAAVQSLMNQSKNIEEVGHPQKGHPKATKRFNPATGKLEDVKP